MAGSTFQPPIHLDPNQDSSQQTAFINQNFQSLASSLNPFIVSDGTTNRIIFGKQNDGTYGLKVSKASVDVGTATNSQLIFNSSQDVFKIVLTSTTTITPPHSWTASNVQTVTIPHGLAATPAFMVYVSNPAIPAVVTYTGGLTNTPAVMWIGAAGGASAYILSAARVDATNLYIDLVNLTTSTQTGLDVYTWSYRYYILQETAN